MRLCVTGSIRNYPDRIWNRQIQNPKIRNPESAGKCQSVGPYQILRQNSFLKLNQSISTLLDGLVMRKIVNRTDINRTDINRTDKFLLL